ncbi:MAG: hypothetical protein AABX37_03500 [Nanoarchaeota archaeon]
MTTNYTLAGALLRRGRVDLKTLAEVEERVRREKSMEDILFRPELLDLAPDIFPPHFVGAFLERNRSQGVKEGDMWDMYLQRMTRSRKHSTLQALTRQIHSAAKADATRRTAAVHPIEFDGVSIPSYHSKEERYFVFPELFAEERLRELQETLVGSTITSAVEQYRQSTGESVPQAFFAMMEQCKKAGLSQQRDVKHKYPVHGLLYGSTVVLPERVREQMQKAGNIVLSNLVSRLSDPREALLFSIDFFLSEEEQLYMGWDIHEQQIGMGLQHQLGVDPSREFYSALTRVVEERTHGKIVSISYDEALCQKNQLYRMEVRALTKNLQEAGLEVRKNAPGGYLLRLFGGREGTPSLQVKTLTDDKLLLDALLKEHAPELAELGVCIPQTYQCTAADVIHTPEKISAVMGMEKVFIHPPVHHGFKPFEVDLGTPVSVAIVQQTLMKKGGLPLEMVPVVVMERIPNGISFAGKTYAHEVRGYFAPEH